MLFDLRIDQLAIGRKRVQRRLFVLLHEAAVAENVGAEYGGELAFHSPPLIMAIILPRVKLCQMSW
jgi:hypothetical protein